VIVRLNLESRTPTVTDINYSGILTGRNDDAFTSCRKAAEMNARRFVRAVLGPHHRKNAEFNQRRFSAQQFFDAREFVLSQVMSGYYLRRYHTKGKDGDCIVIELCR
jgi:hypothetical protein